MSHIPPISRPETNPTTLNELLSHALEKYGDRSVLYAKRSGRWTGISASDFARRVRLRALGLHALGVRPGDHVALFAENSPEWVIADFAILALKAATVPIYVTQMPQQIRYILSDAGVRHMFVSTQHLFKRVKIILPDVGLDRVVCFEDLKEESGVINLETLEQMGKDTDEREPHLYDSLRLSARPSDIAALIYTSGTTATPKGVLLMHSNILSNAIDAGYNIDWDPQKDVILSYLPLSHIFEKMMINLYMYHTVPVYFATSIEALAENLAEVRPTILATVPRMLEKLYDRILMAGSALHGVKRILFDWALRVAKAHDPEHGDSLSLRLQRAVVSTLVFSKWRAAVGGRIRFFISGSAALNPALAKIYFASGIPIMQGYGLTETSPVISVNTFAANRIGSVGKPIRNVEVRIDADNEILVRGPNVMKGFFKNDEATSSVFDDGWFKTGDAGYLDTDGFLFITDRKKDLIKKSSGKFIAPGPIENELRTSSFIEHAAVLGEGRKFAIAILFPNFVALKTWAGERGIPCENHAELVLNPEVHGLYEAEVARTNALHNKWERIVKIILSDHELTIDEGLLTPTMKLRRREIEKKFKDRIDALYRQYEFIEVHEE